MEKCKYCDKEAYYWRQGGIGVCPDHYGQGIYPEPENSPYVTYTPAEDNSQGVVTRHSWSKEEIMAQTEKAHEIGKTIHCPPNEKYLDKLQALGQEWEASPEFSNSTEAAWESLEELRGSRDEWEACARDYLKELSSYREALGTISVTHDSVECRRLAKWALNAKKAVPDESWYEIAKLRDEIKETRERLKASCDTMVEQEAEIARLRERKPLRIYVDAQAKELGEELVAAQAEIAKLRDDQQGRIKMCFEKDAEIDRLKEELKKFQVLKYAKPGVVKK